MAKVIVKDGDINDAMRRFSHITSETKKSARKHEYYLRPGLKYKEKQKEALKAKSKKNKF